MLAPIASTTSLAHLQTSMPKQQHHKKLRRVVPSCLDDPPAPGRHVAPTFPLGNAENLSRRYQCGHRTSIACLHSHNLRFLGSPAGATGEASVGRPHCHHACFCPFATPALRRYTELRFGCCLQASPACKRMILARSVGGVLVALLYYFTDQSGMLGTPSAIDIWLNSGDPQSSSGINSAVSNSR